MNEERAMILKMLREGKISVEEADALLDVLNDEQESEPAGFASREDAPRDREQRSEREEPRTRRRRSKHSDVSFDIDLDLSGVTEGLKSAMSSVKESMAGVRDTLQEAFSDIGDLEIHTDEGFFGKIRTEMGKARAAEDRAIAFPADEATELKITNPWGDVRVVGMATNEVSGTAHVTCWASTEEKARELLAETTVEFEERDGVISLDVPRGSSRKQRVDIELEVPTGIAVTVALSAGDLWLEDVLGPVVAKSISGDIHVANLGDGSDVSQLLTTKSGDISATSVSGSITLSTASGDIRVSGYRGALRATAQSGDVEVEEGSGPIEAKTVSGDLSIGLNAVDSAFGDLAGIKLTSVSGSIEATVPDDLGYAVSLTTLSGSIENELELSNREKSTRSLTGIYGDGAVALSINTVSGDIGLAEA
ncbi:MAG: DUF4097 family beta strand repeat-containing protein [Spirochaetales bacterium]